MEVNNYWRKCLEFYCRVAKCTSRRLAFRLQSAHSLLSFLFRERCCVFVQVCPAASWRRKKRRRSSTPPAPPAGRLSRGDAVRPSRPSPPAAACRAAPGEEAEASSRRAAGGCFILNAVVCVCGPSSQHHTEPSKVRQGETRPGPEEHRGRQERVDRLH